MRRVRRPAIVVLLLLASLLVACGGSQAARPASSGLATRTFSAGAVEVTVEPLAVDASGAIFRVALDTHSSELSADLAKTSALEIGGRAWGGATWTGDGPGGHHRQGELRFQTAGPAAGDVRLTIGGLPAPVVATWSLPASK